MSLLEEGTNETPSACILEMPPLSPFSLELYHKHIESRNTRANGKIEPIDTPTSSGKGSMHVLH